MKKQSGFFLPQIWNLLATEARPTLRLALPVITSQLGQMIMGVVDMFMVGRLGAEALGGVGIGAAVYSTLSVVGIGLILGLDFLVSHSFGRKQMQECNFWLIQSIYLSLFVALPLTLFGYFISFHLGAIGISGAVLENAHLFLKIFIWSLPAFLTYFCFRTYLQAMSHVRFVTVMMIIGNLINAGLDWIFIYGHWGFKPLYTAGPGVATFVTRLFLLTAVVGYTLYMDKKSGWGLMQTSRKFSKSGLAKLIKLGLPASLQLLFEVAVFALSTLLAGRLTANSLAAHSIVLNIASMTFMVPLGLALATSVRVGQFLGAGDPQAARKAGWTSIIMGIIFMALSGITLFTMSRPILSLFSQSEGVLLIGKKILLIAALFQIADGIQTIGTGALRGLGNTRSAMFANLFGHWTLGLPIGYYLCFGTSLEIQGLWIGLTIGLISVATLILRGWIKHSSMKPGDVSPQSL